MEALYMYNTSIKKEINNYKVILTARDFYKEISLIELNQISFGTSEECDIQINLKDDIQRDRFVVNIVKDNDASESGDDIWELYCDSHVYISAEGVLKQYNRVLSYGDDFMLRYRQDSTDVLHLSFIMDFGDYNTDFNRIITIPVGQAIHIGGYDRDEIRIHDELLEDSEFEIRIENTVPNSSDFMDENREAALKTVKIDHINCRYGLYINGNVVSGEVTIHNHDYISLLGYNFYYKDYSLYTTIDKAIEIQGLVYHTEPSTDTQYPRFYRSTRVMEEAEEQKIPILMPPPEIKKPEKNILMSLLPALGTLALTIVLRGVIGGGGTFVVFSACTMGMGIASSVVSFISNARTYKKDVADRYNKYTNYIAEKRQEIEKKRMQELVSLERIYYTPAEEYELAMRFSSDLFHCQREDLDYLTIYLGKGEVESIQQIDYKEQEQMDALDDLSRLPDELKCEYRYLHDAPVVCDIKHYSAVGVVAEQEKCYELIRNWICDLVTRHYHTDVKIIIIGDTQDSAKIEWARLLPHVNQEKYRLISTDTDSAKNLFEYMYQIISQREDDASGQREVSYDIEYIVLVIHDMGIKTHPVSRYVKCAKKYGFHYVFFEENENRIPLGCSRIIRMEKDKKEGTIIDVKNENNSTSFYYLPLSMSQAADIASKFAPVYTEEVSLENTLVKNISLFELLKIKNVHKLDLAQRYESAKTQDSLAAPLGVNAKNEIVYLDLHEKAHGPHGLVAGTTGSGKSEILQSYILSMATLYHPYEVSFMIIDFKGGGMVNQFRKLPHLIGAITNIDGKAIDRSLKSIKAELKKRQQCFAKMGVNRIDLYIQKHKDPEWREQLPILPHLIIIVDEFAELKAEQPEFMKELISAARIGRSLGVHLILATQKPAGQVNEQIWSNSRFKLCLKVQNKEDSNEVLKSPLASEIKEPGRAYLQVGNNEVFELFQSAYSGGPAKGNANRRKNFRIERMSLNGKRDIIYQYEESQGEEEEYTELNAIVDYLYDYCKAMGISKVPEICMPELPHRIEYQGGKEHNDTDYTVPLGIYDDPDNQYQGIYNLDLMSGNTIIIGSSQYGKTNLLQLIIRSLTEQYSSEEFQFYILDFGTRILSIFDKMKHCGGVVCAGEDEKFENLFKLLHKELNLRKEKLMKEGVASYNAYRSLGKKDIPFTILFIDNYVAVKEIYLNNKEVLLDICRDGASLGLVTVMTNPIANGIGYKYLSTFTYKIAFYCNDKNEYSGLYEACKESPDEIPGRCLVEISKRRYECQTYKALSGDDEMEQMQKLRAYIENCNQRNSLQARRIPVVPKILMMKDLTNGYTHRNYTYPLGLNYSEVMPVEVNMEDDIILTLSGRDKYGQTTYLKNMVNYIDQISKNGAAPDHAAGVREQYRIYIIDDIRKKLAELQHMDSVITYSSNTSDAVGIIHDIFEQLKVRYNRLLLGAGAASYDDPMLVLIMNKMDGINAIGNDKTASEEFRQIIGRYKDLGVFIVFSHIPNAIVPYNGHELLKAIKEHKHYLMFEDASQIKLTEVNPISYGKYKLPIEEGEAYYIKNTGFIKVKTTYR